MIGAYLKMCFKCDVTTTDCPQCCAIREIVEKLVPTGVSCAILDYGLDPGSFAECDYAVVRRRTRDSSEHTYFMKVTPMLTAINRLDTPHSLFSQHHTTVSENTGEPSYTRIPDNFISDFRGTPQLDALIEVEKTE